MKNINSNIFIHFTDFRGELILRASSIDGIAPQEKYKATTVYLNGHRVTIELPFEKVVSALRDAEENAASHPSELMTIFCRDEAAENKEISCGFKKRYSTHGKYCGDTPINESGNHLAYRHKTSSAEGIPEEK
ncbi:TPA: hypothetical protein PXO92_004283 [Yersinia enterocolitica]|nr:hypothetical protein [Yersinia enterocolitica]